MYPYPSGDLHIGHWYIVTPTDAICRYRRMNGYNVFFPIGFDAFGLPAENAAIRSGVQPRDWTLRNIENMRRQFRTMGATFDWSREVVTCEPEYYHWNQWFFLKMLEAGLAYRQMAPVDWCPKDQVVLAREQVEGANRVCWRCGTPVIKRDLEQWFLRITKYADELLKYPTTSTGRSRSASSRPTGSAAPRAPRWSSPPHRPITTRAARSCASSPRGRTRCSARPSWCWRRSIRWSSD